jgi:hypothetical protein
MTRKGLSTVLAAHGFITLGAAIILIIAPGLIPRSVGIQLEPSADLIAYLLAGAEIGFAVLSFGGSRVTDSRALQLIVWSCIAFHGSSGILEVYAYIHGVSVIVLGNVAARVIVIILFAYLSKGIATHKTNPL